MRQKSEKLRITVIETSPILLSGLVSTIKHALDCDVVFQEFAENQDYDDLKRFAPDIIVVNPVFLGLQGVKELKKKIPLTSHLVCLKTFVLDESVLNLFEAVTGRRSGWRSGGCRRSPAPARRRWPPGRRWPRSRSPPDAHTGPRC